MCKISKNEKGFTAVEGLLVILIIVVIGAVGYMVYHNDHKTKAASVSNTITKTTTSTKTTTTAPNPYAGWQSYDANGISFSYPSDWQAGIGRDKYTITDVGVTSPDFTNANAFSTQANPTGPLTLTLQLSTDGSIAPSCDNGYTCKIAAVIGLNNSQLPNSSFAIVNQTSPNGTNFTEYAVVQNNTKVGGTTITPLKYGSNNIYVYGQPDYISDENPAANVINVTALQADTHFKELVSLINSVKFN